MTQENLKIFTENVAVELRDDCRTGNILEEMSSGNEAMSFEFMVLLVDDNDIQMIPSAHGTVECEVQQFFGWRSAYGRIGVFEATVTDAYRWAFDGETRQRQPFDLPLIQKGAVITFMYDGLRRIGCICQVKTSSGTQVLKKTEIFADYDVDGRPVSVKRFDGLKLDTILQALQSKEASSPEGSAASAKTEQPGQAFATWAPDNGALSKEEINRLLSDLDKTEENAGQASEKAEGGEGDSDVSGGSDEGEGY